MKKLTYLAIATAALGMVACTGGNKAGYVVTGTVEAVSYTHLHHPRYNPPSYRF